MSVDIGKPFILFLAKAKANCKIYWNEINFSTWCFTWRSFLQSLRCKIRYSLSANSASVPIFHSPSPEFAWNLKCKMWNRASRMIKTSLKYKQDEKKNRSWLSSVQSKARLCTLVACIQTSSTSLLACKKRQFDKNGQRFAKNPPSYWLLHCIA